MKTSRFSDSQIHAILKQYESGIPITGLCREHGMSQVLQDWAQKQQIKLLYIQPGMPTQNAYIERFNRTARHEWLDMHEFENLEHAQLLATQWLWAYNNERPHSAIGGIPPRQLSKTRKLKQTSTFNSH